MMHRYPHEKVRHFAGKINEAGQVSALCFDPPKPIRLAVASWVLKAEHVTCKKCKKLIAETDKIGRADFCTGFTRMRAQLRQGFLATGLKRWLVGHIWTGATLRALGSRSPASAQHE